jgi:hypothetical protein
MFDPLRAPYAFELQALQRQEELLREAAHARLLRAREPSGRLAGAGRPWWGARLARVMGARLVRWGYRLLPLAPPQRLPVGSPAGAPGRAVPPPRPRFGARPGRRACRRPPVRLPRGLSLAGE